LPAVNVFGFVQLGDADVTYVPAVLASVQVPPVVEPSGGFVPLMLPPYAPDTGGQVTAGV